MSPKQKLAAWLGAAGVAAALSLTVGQEGTVLRAYRDSVGILTACVGETHYVSQPGDIVPGAKFTQEQCTDALFRSMAEHAEPVMACGGDKLTLGQKIAFLDFNFNTGKFCGSTMAAKARAGDVEGSCKELYRWRMAGGRDCSVRSNNCYGVWTRRQAEYNRCVS
jgi:lysozyme